VLVGVDIGPILARTGPAHDTDRPVSSRPARRPDVTAGLLGSDEGFQRVAR